LAVPGEILSLVEAAPDSLDRRGLVSFGGTEIEVSLAFVPEAKVGDYVLVHAGVALSRLDEEQAEEIFSIFAEGSEEEGETS
jgi:hydrogenase expression/formation protein HypC